MLLETGAREANLRLYSLVPLTEDFGDSRVTAQLVFTAGSAFPEPPRVVGIWSRDGLFRNICPVRNSSQFGGIGAVSFASVARMTCLMSLLTGVFGRNLIPLLCDGVGKALGWFSVVSCPAFQQIPPQWGFYGLG